MSSRDPVRIHIRSVTFLTSTQGFQELRVSRNEDLSLKVYNFNTTPHREWPVATIHGLKPFQKVCLAMPEPRLRSQSPWRPAG